MIQPDRSPGGLRLRRMLVADLPQVVAVSQAAYANPWSAELFRKELGHAFSTTLLAEDTEAEGEGILGFLVFWMIHDEVHILNVATAPAFRRRGVAEALLREVLRRAHEGRCMQVTLEVRRSNAGAIALYAKLGFDVVGARPHYYAEDDEDAILMTLSLPTAS